jgi:hypothetical protein
VGTSRGSPDWSKGSSRRDRLRGRWSAGALFTRGGYDSEDGFGEGGVSLPRDSDHQLMVDAGEERRLDDLTDSAGDLVVGCGELPGRRSCATLCASISIRPPSMAAAGTQRTGDEDDNREGDDHVPARPSAIDWIPRGHHRGESYSYRTTGGTLHRRHGYDPLAGGHRLETPVRFALLDDAAPSAGPAPEIKHRAVARRVAFNRRFGAM